MIRLPPAAVAVVALLATAGCGGGGQGASAAEIVSRSASATEAVKRFHFTLDVRNVPRTSTGLQLTSAEGDVVVPDRARADVAGNFAGVSITTRIVAIGEDVWLENPLSGAWETIDVSTTPIALLDPSRGVLGVMLGIVDPNDEGAEDVDGVTLRKVSGTATAADVAPLVAVAPSAREVPVMLWIGEDDQLLHRIEVSGPVAAGEPGDAVRVVEISRFDEPVTIEAPDGAG
ncbi:MAG: LppX_LprAFG lipoprotein [Gaiella sp.]|nr:LppX_LprAFG lipoprotein [Gaiella sp.]